MKLKKIKIKSADDLFKQPMGEPFDVEGLKFVPIELKPKGKTKTRASASQT